MIVRDQDGSYWRLYRGALELRAMTRDEWEAWTDSRYSPAYYQAYLDRTTDTPPGTWGRVSWDVTTRVGLSWLQDTIACCVANPEPCTDVVWVGHGESFSWQTCRELLLYLEGFVEGWIAYYSARNPYDWEDVPAPPYHVLRDAALLGWVDVPAHVAQALALWYVGYELRKRKVATGFWVVSL